MNKLLGIALLVVVCVSLCDAAVTAWTNPTLSSKDGSAAANGNFAESLSTTTTTGIALQATAGGTVTYSLTTATSNGATFTIHSSTGVLTFSSGTLDFETYPTLVIVALGVDAGSTGTVTVTLSVTNVDEAPAFPKTTYGLTATEGSAAGTTITTVTAVDPESATVSGYTIFSGDTNSDLSIGATTGVITVATGKTLAMATTPAYVLVVKANDATTNTGSTTVVIVVASASSGVAALTVAMVTVFLGPLIAFLK